MQCLGRARPKLVLSEVEGGAPKGINGPGSCSYNLSHLTLVALLKPGVALAVPVDQRAGCLALTHEKRVTAEMWDTSLSFLGCAAFGINLPGIHPLEVIIAIADGVSCSENCYLVGRTMNDRNPQLSGRSLIHQDRNVSLEVAIEVSAQIEWIYANESSYSFASKPFVTALLITSGM